MDFGLFGGLDWMRKPIARTQMVALRGSDVRAARRARQLRLDQAAELAGVGFGSMSRAERGVPVGVDLAAKICAALGIDLQAATATDAERCPRDGISPEAWAKFKKLARIRIRQAIRQAHREIAEEASTRCWFWPSMRIIRERIVVRQWTTKGEVDL